MRRSPGRAGLLLAVPALALTLSACGSDAGGNDAGASASSSAAESSSSAPQAGSEFCTSSQALLEELGAAFTDQADPASVEGAFRQAAEGFRGVEPPADIEVSWAALADGLDQYAAAFADLDETDQQSVTAFQERTGALQGDLTGAAGEVESYLNEQCGLDTAQDPSGSSGSAAPGS